MVLLDELITGYTNITGWREGFNFTFETDLSLFTNLSTPVLYGTPRAQNADTLMFARTIGITGAATGTATSFDGSANISIPVTSLDASKLTGTAGVNTTGSAAKLTTARSIALFGAATGTATNFDGSANIAIPVTSLDASKLTGTAGVNTTGSAAKLTTPRTISLSGAASGTATNFDGSANISIPVTSLDASKLTGITDVNTTGSAARLTTPRNINGVPFDGTNHITVYDSSKLPMTGGILTGAFAAPWMGVNNTDGTNGRGISLYGGAVNGRPNYGLYFAGTPTFGKHGDITGPWATYFSVITANDTRGWIFQSDDNNVASISTNGVITGTSFVGGLKGNADTASKLSAVRTITFNGDVSGSYGFDGSVNAFCNLTVKLATTAQKGIVQLNNTLTSTAIDQALTAAQGKALADSKANLSGANFTGQISAPVVTAGGSTYPSIHFAPTGATNGAILEMAASGYPYFAIRPVNSLNSSTGQIAFLGLPSTKTGSHTFAMLSDIPDIIDNLTTADKTKPLSAAQGKVLNEDKVSHGDYGLGQTINIPEGKLLADLDLQNSFWSRGSAPLPSDAPNGISAFKAINFGPSPWNSQIVVPAYTNQMFLRSRVTGNGVFHPWREFAFTDSSISGNAATATKLQTPRTINGVSFDGTTNITVSDATKLPLAGGTISGNLTVTGNISTDRFNGSADPLAILTGSSARGINIGQLLVSNQYADANKVPVNGGYIKGSLIVDGGITGNASSASKLALARTISASGDGTWSVSFDGSANVSGIFTLANSGVAAGTYQSVTVDAKGRVTAGQTVTTGLVTSNAATGTANTATSNTNTFLNVVESKGGVASSVGTSTQVTGAGSVTVSSDTAGKLVITGANTTYTAGNGLSLTGTVFSAKLLNVLTSTDITSALTAAQGKVLKDTVDQKLDKTGGTITGDLAVKGKFTLDQSNIVVVSGSDYQITYDYATRIATIEMTLFENKRIMDAMPRYSSRNAWVFALEVSLPIQLKKRLTEQFYISEYLEGQTQFGEEASEWMFNCMSSNYQPYSKDTNGAYVADPAKRAPALGESKVFILARRWSGDQDEPCNGYLRVTGFF